MYNDQFKIVSNHLNEFQKYLLMETEMFPDEWRKIAFTLQFQRIPDEYQIFISNIPVISNLPINDVFDIIGPFEISTKSPNL